MSMFPSRASFPEADPELCVTFFTCTGTGVAGTVDLEHAYPAAVRYLDAQRHLPPSSAALAAGSSELGSALRYELAWLDNGSDRTIVDAFLRRGAQFDHQLSNPSNEGLFRAVNDVWFRKSFRERERGRERERERERERRGWGERD